MSNSKCQIKFYNGTIYQAINKVNGKSYIGQTIRNFNWYKNKHIKFALKGCKKYFYSAIRKHSQENFEWRILYQKKCTKDHINYAEKFFIAYYETYGKNGYNLTPGGEGVDSISQTNIMKMIDEKTGKTIAQLRTIKGMKKRQITMLNDIDENGLNSYQRTAIKCRKTKLNDIDENGLNSYQRAHIKSIQTMLNDIDENGLNKIKRISLKALNTMKNTIDENGLTIIDKRTQTLIDTMKKIDEKTGLNGFQQKARKTVENLKKTIDEKTGKSKFQLKEEKRRNTVIENKVFKGKNHPGAKKWKLIDPNGKEYFIHGELRKFCKEYNLSFNTLLTNKNKIIKITNRKNTTNKRINTIGWLLQ